MTNRGHPLQQPGEWPTKPSLHQHNKLLVTVFKLQRWPHLLDRRNPKKGCVNLRKSTNRTDSRPNQSLTGVFPTKHPQHLGTTCFTRNARDKNCRVYNTTHPRQGILVLEQHRCILQNQPLRSFRGARIHHLAPSRLLEAEHFLSLQHSYSKFGVIRTILPTNATTEKKQQQNREVLNKLSKQQNNTEFNDNNNNSSNYAANRVAKFSTLLGSFSEEIVE